ncbi:S-layer family protein [Nostoc sp. FACHB-87]|uniref:two-partner secretion domain-containing protein n=1 Tax=Nostocales TaxID=1161 RepID=UPI001686FC98|nr:MULTISPECIES: S-layer family protein [Nostocales]MBD2299993.1 S-layer family protein [Nostoc sp. FACHB-190]MBD2453809.1 S-layer family protein [Nostoc sp. FACHB-87]MBD2475235.1 S-layer family protein [Anabaena sp. FACHB-83]MBD2489058.1 S-layer family protein [Aulosira sp. FACHB-615]
MKLNFVGFALLGAICISTVCDRGVNAQVTPDETLNTTVSISGKNYAITNGTRVGNNLFHSFSQFSVPSNGSAVFSNTADIQNIFSRVTGGNVSHIDGLIKANGNANLFLLNPAGIIFSKNASLNIGGSFVATTANSIKFADGVEFSAVNPTGTPLLTMNVPVGLQMGRNAGAIEVQGTPANNFLFRMPTLSMAANQTLAMIGGQIDIKSASISAPDGHVELWAIKNGTVNIPTSGNWQLASLSTSPTWGKITLQQSSYINTSGDMGGAINIRGRGLTLQDGSNIESSTRANGQGQGITVKTTEFVDLMGISHPANYALPGLSTSVTGSRATSGNITVDTPRLRLANGAWINSFNFGVNFLTSASIDNAKTGNITIRATDVDVSGYSPFTNPISGFPTISAITTLVSGGQQNTSGTITVNAERVRVLDGARISTSLFGFPNPTTGKTGDILITATESLDIRGKTPGGVTSAVLSALEMSAEGQGGNITINTRQLALANGGKISSAISGSPISAQASSGIAGNITIQATDVQVSDPVLDIVNNISSGITVAIGQNSIGQGGNIRLTADSLRVFNGGQITSSTNGKGAAGNINLQVKNIDVQGISQPLSNGQILPSSISATSTTNFNAGSINLVADRLNVLDDGQISVSNTGGGNSGNLLVNANQIKLKEGGSLLAEVSAGDQGNISLVADVLLMRYGSKINTSATGTATGGNISINVPIIVGLENSDITANAVQGKGGNINITTQGIIGLEYRLQLTPENDITASSQFGVNGTVDIDNVGVDPNSGLVTLPANLTDPSQQIANGCTANIGSSFVAIGRGGIPQNPIQGLSSDRTWSDTRDISAFNTKQRIQAQIPKSPEILVQATGWRLNAQGKIELIADKSSVNLSPSLTCSAVNKI